MNLRLKTIFLLLTVFTIFQSYAQDATTLVKLADSVPAFNFEVIPGVTKNITDLNGKLVLITFFATWCGPCRKELPHIQSDIYNKYKNNPKFEILIFGREHSWAEVNKFKAENHFSMPFYPDQERKIYSQFATQFIPRNFLISPEGKILMSTQGFEEKDFKKLKGTIEKELQK